MIDVSPAVRELLLSFADDEHLMGQQHTEWIGVAPFLEEDLAFASIGQDELGHAALLFEALVGDDDADIDALAFFREPADWRSCALVEINLPEWSDTLVRHWLYDAAEELRWQSFADSSIGELADISVRALSEERFHRQHADALLDVLLSVDEARERLTASLHTLLPLAMALFDGVAGEAEAVAQGVIDQPFLGYMRTWQSRVEARFDATLDWPALAGVDTSKRTQRHADFAPLLSRMLEVFDLDRAAAW